MQPLLPPRTRAPFRPHLAVDGLCLSERRGGIGEYTWHLVKHLLRRGDVRVTCFLPTRSPTVAADLIEAGAEVVPVPWTLARARDQILWENARLRSRVRRLQPDLFFGPNFALPPLLGRPSIVTLHDFAIDHHPETKSWQFRRYLRWMIRRAARRADILLTDSRAVAEDLLARYHPSPERVRVAPLAPTEALRRADPGLISQVLRRKALDPSGYVLHVSNFDERKNVEPLAMAFAEVCEELGRPDKLVLAGGHPWTASLGKRLRARGLDDRIRFTGYLPSSELAALYTGARFFAFPSLYEGFGLPVLEAMACGAPVLTSDRGALAEVAGDAALLVDPTCAESLRSGVRSLLTDESLCADLRARGAQRVRAFSWTACADATFGAIETVLRRYHRWPATLTVPQMPRRVAVEGTRPPARPLTRS